MRRRKKSKWTVMGILVLTITLLLSMTAFAKEMTQLEETEKAWWSDTTTARWKKVDKAKSYQVRLYGDGDEYIRSQTVENTYFDFSSYMRDGRDYYFEVRAVATRSQRGYLQDGEWVVSDYQEAEDIGDVAGRWLSYQDGKKYRTRESKDIINEWYRIRGDWYWFNADGYMQTGWQNLNGQWYYLGSDGVMQTGWKQIDGIWYHLKEDGSMTTGWLQSKPGQWYYLNADGSMAVNAVIEGYQLDANGLCTR